MAKCKLLIEFEFPDGFDACWDIDQSGRQAFHDAVYSNALLGALRLQNKQCSTDSETDRLFSEYLEKKYSTINSVKVIGYYENNELKMIE